MITEGSFLLVSEDWGKELKKLRVMKGLSLRQVEELTGVSNSFLSQLESGKRDLPSIKIMNKLSKVYGIGIWEVFKDASNVPLSNVTLNISPEMAFIQSAFPRLAKDDQKMFIDWLTFKLKQKPPKNRPTRK
jgi:transcriptional regulator with XRE-family HTH domain